MEVVSAGTINVPTDPSCKNSCAGLCKGLRPQPTNNFFSLSHSPWMLHNETA